MRRTMKLQPLYNAKRKNSNPNNMTPLYKGSDVIGCFDGDFAGLSNFAKAYVRVGSEVFESVEHGYQASKTTNLNERKQFQNITAGKAKRLARSITIRPDWEDNNHLIRRQVMYELLTQKFSYPYYRRLLLATGNRRITEGNDRGDLFWGTDLYTGIGDDVLGLMLMEIRDDLRANPPTFTVLNDNSLITRIKTRLKRLVTKLGFSTSK